MQQKPLMIHFTKKASRCSVTEAKLLEGEVVREFEKIPKKKTAACNTRIGIQENRKLITPACSRKGGSRQGGGGGVDLSLFFKQY